MPIYEYQCQGCGQVFEVFQKVSDPAPSQHSCGSTQVQRILSHTSFVLKGTGWYVTDYPDTSKKDSKAEAKTDKPSDAKKEAKTEAKTADATKPAAPTTSSAPAAKETSSGGPGSSGGGGTAAA